ncbi:MAG UNVERIFIED_CONTAM: septal ring lytic transglycosylase RlpA family protein [Rickettsiaceae bacterium]|jgi:rare lipoprotein A
MSRSGIITIILLLFLSACAGKKHDTHYQGHYKVGSKYSKNGKDYQPAKNIKYKKIGTASWYGSKDGFHGKKTANGDRFNKNMLTAAHPTLPMPSMVKVTNIKNHKSVIVMINDRGPFRKDRILDLSEKAATILGFKNQGTAKVQVEYLDRETKELLWKLSLNAKHGSKARGKIRNAKCSIDCHIKKVNKKSRHRINKI